MQTSDLYAAIINESGHILSCNSPLSQKLGFDDNESLIGKDIFEVFKVWETEKLKAAIDTCLCHPELTITVSVRYNDQSNHPYNYQWTITGESQEGKKPVIRLIGKVCPCSKRNPDDEIYSLYEEFMRNSPIVGWVTDENGVMHYMNPLYLSSYGLSSADNGKSIFEIFTPDIATEYFENNAAVLRTNQAVETIEKAILPNGQEQILKIYKFPLTIYGKRMVAGWGIDISDQVALQNELSKNVERFHFVKKATSDAIYDWDLEKNIIYRGFGFQTLFGYPDLRGSIRFSFQHIHPEDLKRVKETVFESLRSDRDKWKIEYRFKDASGKYRHVADKAYIIREDGKVLRVIGAMQDITEQRELQDKLIKKEASYRRQVVRNIINTQEKERRQLSIELHDNVNQILSSCKLMLDVAKSNHELSSTLTTKACDQLQLAINEIRKISHELNPSVLQDIGLIDAVRQLIESINSTGKIKVHLTTAGCLSAECLKEEDRIVIYRIIQEKMTNIIKHSNASAAHILLSFIDGDLQLIMEDNGQGFDVNTVKKGIGLKSIQNRVEYYQGTMKFETAPGKGCRMEINMKVKNYKAAAAEH